MASTMTMYRGSTERVWYVEQDGDIGFGETDTNKWTLRLKGADELVFETFTELEAYLYEQFPEINAIILHKYV